MKVEEYKVCILFEMDKKDYVDLALEKAELQPNDVWYIGD